MIFIMPTLCVNYKVGTVKQMISDEEIKGDEGREIQVIK